jgi:hypothetical protein
MKSMTTTAIREKLITYISEANDRKVKGLYMLVEDEITSGEDFKLTEEHFKILEEESQNHASGKSKSYSWQEAKEIIRGKKKF